MIGYRISRTGLARKPFFVRCISRNLWSVEELCWFLANYPALIDEDIVGVRLTRWLAEEFHITGTAIRMEKGLKSGGAEAFLMPLFQDSEYLTTKELAAFTGALRRLATAGTAWRLKLRADALAANRRFGQAVAAYRKARDCAPDHDRLLGEQIRHNCGTAWMQLMECGEAAEEFLTAYEESGKEEEKKAYLTALILGGMPGRAREEAVRLRVPGEDLARIRRDVEEASSGAPEPSEDPEALKEELRELCREYHREA